MKVLVDGRLWAHPKLLRFAKLLGRNPTEAAGYLVRLWSWAAEYRLDGSLAALEDREVCSASGWLGEGRKFMSALRGSGWVKNAQIHDWQEHQGKYIGKMLAERARKRRGKGAEVPRSNASPGSLSGSGSGSVSGTLSGTSAAGADGAPPEGGVAVKPNGVDGERCLDQAKKKASLLKSESSRTKLLEFVGYLENQESIPAKRVQEFTDQLFNLHGSLIGDNGIPVDKIFCYALEETMKAKVFQPAYAGTVMRNAVMKWRDGALKL